MSSQRFCIRISLGKIHKSFNHKIISQTIVRNREIILNLLHYLPTSSIIIFSGSKERSQGRLKSPCKSSKEERRWRRRKGQKEEVVQGKNPRQIEQLGLVRQAYLRQTVERSSNLQTYHTFDCEWKIKGPWIPGSQGFARTCPER